jgi:peptide/nickel transport system permease protein
VLSEVMRAVGNTVMLAIAAAMIGFTLGLLFGLIAGYFRDTWVDKVATSIAIAGVSLPHYWLGMVLVIIFSVQLNWLPAVGAGPGGSGAWAWDWEHLRYLVLPAITTSVIPMGIASITVLPTARITSDSTGRPVAIELPRSPWIARHSHRPNCTGSGRSKP